jgi:hypothetical protein
VRLAPLAIALTIALGACDGSRTQAPPPLDPPVQSSQGGGACSQTDVDGATVVRFESDGSCLPGDVMVLYRCTPGAVPVLRISSVAGPALFLGGPFAVRAHGTVAPTRGPPVAERSSDRVGDR